jgi:hypothetical protein
MADWRWYPDVAAAASASRAWQPEFDGLEVTPTDGVVGAHRGATVRHGDLQADVMLGWAERSFRLNLRSGRSVVMQGFAPDLAAAARPARRWLAGARAPAIAAAFPFLGSVALAEAEERGDRRAAKWLWLRENHCDGPVGQRLSAFVALAFHEPRLRALYPYTSHYVLCFSQTTEWPYTRGLPKVEPVTPSRFVVHAPGRRAYEETDAAGALRLVLAEMDG